MAIDKPQTIGSEKNRSFHVKGKIICEEAECQNDELHLSVYLFDLVGSLVGSAILDEKGNYSVKAKIHAPMDLELVVGPTGQKKDIRNASTYSKTLTAASWKEKKGVYTIVHEHFVAVSLWKLWLPKRICISGTIRKVVNTDGDIDHCPVPFVKVEVFDVDRGWCLYPYFRKHPELILKSPVIRLPELLIEPPVPPKPIPGPDPVMMRSKSLISGKDNTFLSPQPEPPDLECTDCGTTDITAVGPQPIPPDIPTAAELFQKSSQADTLHPTLAKRLEQITLTSHIAPWKLSPLCFYWRSFIGERVTDCDGAFNLCFDWWPLKYRRGRLRYDARPDIIIRVTQIINGIENVIYMDPYSSVRWNADNTQIDLDLDNEEIQCGNGHCYEPPEGSPVFFTRVGDDEVFMINQTSGLYSGEGLNNVAYGHTLSLYGQFGDLLTRSDIDHGGDYYYYRLSYAKTGSSKFTYIDRNLSDTRVSKVSLHAQSHKLGPLTIGAESSLYEVRNFRDYYWYNPDWIGIFNSRLTEEDTGKYILRLEMFDKNGNKINSASAIVDYRNGALFDLSGEMVQMTDHCDLTMTLDNKRPVAEITIPAALNECGVIPWTDVPPLDIHVHASQENGRLYHWALHYTKGVGVEATLAAASNPNGFPGGIQTPIINADAQIAGISTTCAFSFRVKARALIRNGRRLIYWDQDIDSIAIEKCPECPSCD